MTAAEQERFAQLCVEEADADSVGNGIGTYREKRLHRVLKRWVCDDEERQEIPVGKYVADVLDGNRITEIQTGSFYPLLPKLRYYLEETDYDVTLIYPVIAENMLFRMDRETGELLRKRRSNARGRVADLLPELFWIREVVPSPRLTVRVLLIRAEEYRYSERMRYRREGAYDADFFPRELLGETVFTTPEEYRDFLPEAETFTAADYAKWIKMKSRNAGRALHTLLSLGFLEREKDGKKYIYRKK